MLSGKTTKALAIFTAVATTAAFASCGVEDENVQAEQDKANVLTDSDGNEYTLTQNDDGSETADYGDGRRVTFKRDDDGNLSFISGTASLLAGLAAGYYLFHGLSNGRGGYYNAQTHRYTTFDPVQKVKDKDTSSGSSSGYSGSRSANSKSTDTSNSKSTSTSSSKSSTKSTAKSSVSSSSKSGFGSAGARSSSS